MKMNRLTTLIMIAMVLGVIVGYACNTMAGGPAAAKEIAGYFGILTDIFLRLIKMIIAPLVFATLVVGLAGMGDSKTVGRIGAKALGWFVAASLCSLALGLIFANLLQPGANLGVPLPELGSAVGLKTSALNLKDFITHVFPKNFFEAMAANEILQILVFAVFFGLALGHLHNQAARSLVNTMEEVVHVMLKVTDYVMRFAPIGVFGAVAGIITTQGLGMLVVFGKLLASFYIALAVLWLVLIAAGYFVLGKEVFRLLKLVRSPMLLGFSTASSESAYPKLMEQLEKFGVKDRITGFVLPLGYSFNLDGSMLYCAFAALFIGQAYGIDLSLGTQITMLLVLMISSKGVAGVPRSSLVVVAAVLPMFGLPEAGLLLILGIDHFLDMGRTATNVLGNAIATAVVAKWENGIDPVDESLAEIDETHCRCWRRSGSCQRRLTTPGSWGSASPLGRTLLRPGTIRAGSFFLGITNDYRLVHPRARRLLRRHGRCRGRRRRPDPDSGTAGQFPQTAIPTLFGTNKVSSIAGTGAALWRYARAVRIPWFVVLPATVAALIGAWGGAALVAWIPRETMRPMVVVHDRRRALHLHEEGSRPAVKRVLNRPRDRWKRRAVRPGHRRLRRLLRPGHRQLPDLRLRSPVRHGFRPGPRPAPRSSISPPTSRRLPSSPATARFSGRSA
jgi:Na+/H+-dicarboxylate symporter